MTSPLHGFRVVDFSTGTAGTRAGGLLADYGAEVIWIEPPGGDPHRQELAVEYSVFNRGKGSAVLDLRDATDTEAFMRLLAGADVFLESRRPGVAARLGLGYEDLHRRFPSLVYCSISGWGDDGPDLPGYESLIHAVVGTMGEQPGVLRGAPIYEGLPFASTGASYLGVIGILAALYRRAEDGVGRHIETSLVDGALTYLTMLWNDSDTPMPPRDPGGRRLIARNFSCADGEIIGVHTGAVGAFGRLMKLLDLGDRIPSSDDGLDMGIPLTPEQREVLDASLPDIFATRLRDAWLTELTSADICAVPLLTALQVMDEPQVVHNRMIHRIDDPLLGPIEQFAPAGRFPGHPAPNPTPAPLPGEANQRLDDLSERQPFGVGAASPDATVPLLHGLKVLDLGAFYAGPYGSRLLADLGADVVRVETLGGDPNRGSEGIFRNSHAGTRSIALNLKHPDGQRAVRDAIAWADIVHHSMRPGAAERLGVDYASARAIRADVIYAYAPGWGSDGPMSARQSFAPLLSGYVGAAYEVAGQHNPPVYPSGNEDPANGLLGAIVMLMGAIERRLSGHGQYIEHPQLNAALHQMAHIVRRPDGDPVGAMRLDPLQLGTSALDRLYEVDDGWVCIAAHSDAELRALGTTIGLDLLADDRFSDPSAREANDYELSQLIEGALSGRTVDGALSLLGSLGVPAVSPKPHNLQGFLRDPVNIASLRVAELPHPDRGRIREIAVLLRASDSAPKPHRLAPGLGEHTVEVLAELGWSASKIEDLIADGAARAANPIGSVAQ